MTGWLWEKLAAEKRPVVLYGTGNGADKILDRLERLGVSVSGIFASDGFVRKRTFRGFEVESYKSAVRRLGDDIIILVAFGSSRRDVIENVIGMSGRHTVLLPDMPVAGENVWCREFAEKHAEMIAAARDMLADGKSRALFDSVLRYREGGELAPLLENLSTEDEIWRETLRPELYTRAADVGAYNGDTAAGLLSRAPRIEKITAVEPDEKNFSSLCVTAGIYGRIMPVRAAAWDRREVLTFSRDGGRGAGKRKTGEKRTSEVIGLPLDSILGDEGADYIKIDSEGAEGRVLAGAAQTISEFHPDLRVAAYHRPEDVFALPLLIDELCPGYGFYLRRTPCTPCWELDLIARYRG
ncbi:MAG: FkbM family methyltransferase [Clostridia bacterium]|nr:FkbM family methyltransferase [Clostridia bacterium]MBR5767939.1 FkbM family methyltransferase [Clostridia bacterium]